MKTSFDQLQIESLLEMLNTSLDLCGKAVSSASASVDFPDETEVSLLDIARAYRSVRNLADTFKEYAEITK